MMTDLGEGCDVYAPRVNEYPEGIFRRSLPSETMILRSVYEQAKHNIPEVYPGLTRSSLDGTTSKL